MVLSEQNLNVQDKVSVDVNEASNAKIPKITPKTETAECSVDRIDCDEPPIRQNPNAKLRTKKTKFQDKIRVGRDFQASCPPLVPLSERNVNKMREHALLVWTPTELITERQIDEFITTARENHGYNAEQAMGLLFWHRHDIGLASRDLPNFTPLPNMWTVEDKVQFAQAFRYYGKDFQRIQTMLPDKPIASLILHYYLTKKTRQSFIEMEQQEQLEREEQKRNDMDDNVILSHADIQILFN